MQILEGHSIQAPTTYSRFKVICGLGESFERILAKASTPAFVIFIGLSLSLKRRRSCSGVNLRKKDFNKGRPKSASCKCGNPLSVTGVLKKIR